MSKFTGSPHLYRAWLYGGGDVTRRRKRKDLKPPRQEPTRRYVRLLLRTKPEANPQGYWWWRQRVIALAGGLCARCGCGGKLDAHHIKPWRTHPELRYHLGNGQALCRECHEKAEGRK